jgi:hypothetical protein
MMTQQQCDDVATLSELLGQFDPDETACAASKKGWIRAEPAEDRRQVRLTLTGTREREYRHASLPRSAQGRLRQALGKAAWKEVMKATVRATALAQEGSSHAIPLQRESVAIAEVSLSPFALSCATATLEINTATAMPNLIALDITCSLQNVTRTSIFTFAHCTKRRTRS